MKQQLDKKDTVISKLQKDKDDLVSAKSTSEETLKKLQETSDGETQMCFSWAQPQS